MNKYRYWQGNFYFWHTIGRMRSGVEAASNSSCHGDSNTILRQLADVACRSVRYTETSEGASSTGAETVYEIHTHVYLVQPSPKMTNIITD